MAAGAHFGCPKFTSDRISGHFRSIRNFYFFWKFLTKWLPSAILDVGNSLSIAFLAIFDQCAIFFGNFDNMAAIGHFGCPKFTFDRISGHFRSIRPPPYGRTSRVWDSLLVMKSGCAGGRGLAPRPGQ